MSDNDAQFVTCLGVCVAHIFYTTLARKHTWHAAILSINLDITCSFLTVPSSFPHPLLSFPPPPPPGRKHITDHYPLYALGSEQCVTPPFPRFVARRSGHFNGLPQPRLRDPYIFCVCTRMHVYAHMITPITIYSGDNFCYYAHLVG